LQPGKHVLTLTAEDAAGNQAVLSVEVTVPSPGVSSEVLIAIALAAVLAVVVGLIIFRKRRKG
jgi:Na+(H+)/acetate symporter ActP